jgi:hypothetical protein
MSKLFHILKDFIHTKPTIFYPLDDYDKLFVQNWDVRGFHHRLNHRTVEGLDLLVTEKTVKE